MRTRSTRSSSWRCEGVCCCERACHLPCLGCRCSNPAWPGLQQREHMIDNKKVEAKAAVPKNSGSSSALTRKMFVGGTVSDRCPAP